MAKNVDNTENHGLSVEETLTKTELFIEKNKKIISIIVGGIVVIVGSVILYTKFVSEPKEREAQAAMFMAQNYFEKDSMKLALNGDGKNLGFLEIIDTYGSTKAGNISYYYAGICNLHLGKFQDAIDNLNKFSSDDEMISCIAIGATGDAYMELGNAEEAVKQYKKASEHRENKFTTPYYLMKAGQTYQDMGKTEDALACFEKLNKEYSRSNEGREAEKYIALIKAQTGK